MKSQDPAEVKLGHERAMARWAVGQWTAFPVDQYPRPLVFTGPIVLPEKGFRTGEAKIAFLRGDIEVHGPIPDDVIAILREAGSPPRHPGPCVNPLVLTDGKQSERAFSTDRGQRLFPSWRFDGEELLGALSVLDPEVAGRSWNPVETSNRPAPAHAARIHRSFRSRIEADDHTLHFEFTGGSPKWVDYPTSEVTESDRAIAVIPVELDHGPAGPRRAIGYGREVVVHLRGPLGTRVLVNLDASPVAVLT